MSILIKSGKNYYEIPANVLKKCKITKAKFEKGKKKMSTKKSADVTGQSDVYIGASCCLDKKSLWASCLD